MQTRKLGKTGETLSVVGFGGIVVMKETQEDANRYVAEAIERGVRYFDVAPTYGDAEDRLGPALERFRKDVFLACKTAERRRDGASEQLESTLRKMRTDHVDLYQLHGICSMDEAETALGPGGAVETLVDAKKRGLARFIGFSAHDEDAAMHMVETFDFDTVMFPINYAAWLKNDFGARIVAAAQKKGMGILALKALAQRKWKADEERTHPKCWYKPVDTPEEAKLALRFTLSKGVTAAVSPSHAELLWWECDAADDVSPLTPEEESQLREMAEELDPVFPSA